MYMLAYFGCWLAFSFSKPLVPPVHPSLSTVVCGLYTACSIHPANAELSSVDPHRILPGSTVVR